MFVKSHRKIGRIVYDKLSLKYKLSFRNKYINGNILPDILLICMKSSNYHYPNVSWDFVNNLIKEIEDMDITVEKQMKVFLKQLGVIHHYLCDFFCYAHNGSEYRENVFKHALYEIKIDRIVKNAFFRENKNIMELYENLKQKELSIEEFIRFCHNEYLTFKRDIYTDIEFALNVCYNVSEYIIEQKIASSNIDNQKVLLINQ